MKDTMTRIRNQRGETSIGLIIGMGLLVAIGAIVAFSVVNGMDAKDRSTQTSDATAQLNDAVARVSRDVAAAQPILATKPRTKDGAVRAKESPSKDELWTQTVHDGDCLRQRYFVDGNSFKSHTYIYKGRGCPDPEDFDDNMKPGEKTVIKNFTDKNRAGATQPVFRYFDKDLKEVTALGSNTDVNDIASVQVDVGATMADLDYPVRLTTATALRSKGGLGDGSVASGANPVSCLSYDNIKGADPAVTVGAGWRPAATVQWKHAQGATGYELFRLNADGTRASGNLATPATLPAVGVNMPAVTVNFAEGELAASDGTPFVRFQLVVFNDGPSLTCNFENTVDPVNDPDTVRVLGPTSLRVEITPRSVSTPPALTGASPTTVVWTKSTNAAHYTVERTLGASDASTNWETVAKVAVGANGSHTATMGGPVTDSGNELEMRLSTPVDTIYTWRVTATDPWWANLKAAISNADTALAHTAAPVDFAAAIGSASDYSSVLTWRKPANSTATGFTIWKRTQGASAWTIHGTTPASSTSYADTNVTPGVTYEYMISATNTGARGLTVNNGIEQTYHGPATYTLAVMMLPNEVDYAVFGTDSPSVTNGQYTVRWQAVPGATQYRVVEYNSPTAAPAEYVRSTTVDANTLSVDLASREAPGSRTFFHVIATTAAGQAPSSVNHTRLSAAMNRDTFRTTGLPVSMVAGNDNRPDSVGYQAPTNPDLTLVNKPSLATHTNNTFTTPSSYPDAGEASDKFCGTPVSPADPTAGCKEEFKNPDAAVQITVPPNEGSFTGTYSASGFGKTDTVTLTSCNAGGCAASSDTIDTYPGAFNLTMPSTDVPGQNIQFWHHPQYTWNGDAGTTLTNTAAVTDPAHSFYRQLANVDYTPSGYLEWSNSAGATQYTWGDKPTKDVWPGTTTRILADTSVWRANTTTNGTLAGSPATPKFTTEKTLRVPGHRYRATVTATAPNGLSRTVNLTYQMRMARIGLMHTQRMCAPNITDDSSTTNGFAAPGRGGTKVLRRQGGFTMVSADFNNNGRRGVIGGDTNEWIYAPFTNFRYVEFMGRPKDWVTGGDVWGPMADFVVAKADTGLEIHNGPWWSGTWLGDIYNGDRALSSGDQLAYWNGGTWNPTQAQKVDRSGLMPAQPAVGGGVNAAAELSSDNRYLTDVIAFGAATYAYARRDFPAGEVDPDSGDIVSGHVRGGQTIVRMPNAREGANIVGSPTNPNSWETINCPSATYTGTSTTIPNGKWRRIPTVNNRTNHVWHYGLAVPNRSGQHDWLDDIIGHYS